MMMELGLLNPQKERMHLLLTHIQRVIVSLKLLQFKVNVRLFLFILGIIRTHHFGPVQTPQELELLALKFGQS